MGILTCLYRFNKTKTNSINWDASGSNSVICTCLFDKRVKDLTKEFRSPLLHLLNVITSTVQTFG